MSRFARRAWLLLTSLSCMLVACRLDVREPTLSEATFGGDPCVLVSTSEFGVEGALARIATDTRAVDDRVTTVHHDTRVALVDGRPWAIERQGADSVRALNDALGTLWSLSLDPSDNPTSAAWREDHALVSLYNANALAVVDGSGALVARTSLDAFADDDGGAEPDLVIATPASWWVFLQRLDGFQCGNAPLLVPVDASGAPDRARSIALPGCNPVDAAFEGPHALLVAMPGVYRTLAPQLGVPITDDGGVVRVDLERGTAERVWSEADVGGDVGALAVGEGWAWLLVSDENFATRLIGVELEGEAIRFETELDGAAFDLAQVGDEVWVAVRSPVDPGVQAFDARTGAPLGARIRTQLPPYELLPLPSCSDGAGSRAASGSP